MSIHNPGPVVDSHDPPLPPPPQADSQAQGITRMGRLKSVGSAVGPADFARILLGSLLVFMLIFTWVSGTPDSDDAGTPSDWIRDVDAAVFSNELNNGETDGAPQQSVVNGWYANDLALIEASQNTYMAASSDRNGKILFIIGLGVAGELIIRGVKRPNRLSAAA